MGNPIRPVPIHPSLVPFFRVIAAPIVQSIARGSLGDGWLEPQANRALPRRRRYICDVIRSRVTLRDVARRARVHTSTASRALNPATRERITERIARRVTLAAEELGNQPNPSAYGLKTNRSRTVGVVIPDIANPVFPPILRGIEDAFAESGYTAVLANTDNDGERESSVFHEMLARRVDGLILATARRRDPLVDRCLA